MSTYRKLFEPYTLRSGVELKNRILMAPMTARQSFDNGMITMDEIAYYERRAKGVSMLITACANVTEDGRAFKGGPSIASDRMIPGHAKLATAIQKQGAKAVLQIFHGGRNVPPDAIGCKQPVCASSVAALRDGAVVPRALSSEEVEAIVEAFGEATRRAIQAGYDGVEIHGANTYLIQQFFSPQSNVRDDKWGGDLVRRMAFPLAVARKVCETVEKHATKPFIVGYRISPEEPHTPGIELAETIQLLERLTDLPLDYVHLSLADVWRTSAREANATPVLIRMQEAIGDKVPLVGVGSIVHPDDALSVVEQGIPFVAIGRALVVEPEWVEKVQEGHVDELRMTMSERDREELTISPAMWDYIAAVQGWFPIEE